MSKEIKDWFRLKIKLCSEAKRPIFAEREVWWCSIGLNIGTEEYGKNELMNRPVIVIKKYDQNSFFGLPTTSVLKDRHYFARFSLRNREMAALLAQGRTFDAARLNNRLGVLPEDDFYIIKERLFDFLS